jgi:uncharacterized protein YndB with AHSA1/START domain
MQVQYNSQYSINDVTALQQTGRRLDEWFALLDDRGGPAAGRRALGDVLFKELKVDAWWVTTLLVEYEAARGVVEKDRRPKGYNVCVTKSISAAPARIYEALCDAEVLFGAGAKAEFREGGRIDAGAGLGGVFRKVAAARTLRFTWEGERHGAAEVVEVKFTPMGAKTSVVLTHDRLAGRPEADGMRAAWAEALERLKAKLG